MIPFPAIDPVAVRLGPLAIHWYGLSYIAGIALAWWYLRARAAAHGWTAEAVGDLVFYSALGGVLGGRIGYALFYNAATYAAIHWPFSASGKAACRSTAGSSGSCSCWSG